MVNAGKELNGEISYDFERTADKAANSWSDIDWQKAEAFVNRLQIRIAKATQSGNPNLAKRLGYLLTHSFYAKIQKNRRRVAKYGLAACQGGQVTIV